MQYLLNQISFLKKQLSGKQLFVFMDYDGTIVPIADCPDKAVISQKMKSLIDRLSRIHNVKVAIVSGRGLKDVKKMVGIKGIIYAGNHGLEIEGPRINYKVKISEIAIALLHSIKKLLSYKLGSIKGVVIEDKGLGVAIHYRNVENSIVSMVEWYFNYIVQPYLITNKIDILTGKMVCEVRPNIDWNKGNAVMWLISKYKKETNKELLPMYMGDDVTDESVFKCLENIGITVYVGEDKKTAAKYYLKDAGEVYEFLKTIEALCVQ